ncbi:MAG: hypothetical protein GWP08_08030, partial [Nitrospiraceae bacterium]|nr:hypothetical protein [Nitrospiraceae bacterium]
MGSRKTLVLASLVSLMMVLAFLIGLVPSETTLGADAASSSGGRLEMADILAAALGLKAGDPPTAIDVAAPANGTEVKVPADSVAAYLSLKASAVGGDPAPVRYGVDGAFTAANTWEGDVYSPADATVGPDYASYVDLAPLLTGTPSALGTTHWLYAFANASVATKLAAAQVTYSVASLSGPGDLNEVMFSIVETDP